MYIKCIASQNLTREKFNARWLSFHHLFRQSLTIPVQYLRFFIIFPFLNLFHCAFSPKVVYIFLSLSSIKTPLAQKQNTLHTYIFTVDPYYKYIMYQFNKFVLPGNQHITYYICKYNYVCISTRMFHMYVFVPRVVGKKFFLRALLPFIFYGQISMKFCGLVVQVIKQSFAVQYVRSPIISHFRGKTLFQEILSKIRNFFIKLFATSSISRGYIFLGYCNSILILLQKDLHLDTSKLATNTPK